MSVWTPEIVAELTRRWNAKESSSSIARALNLTKNQVVGKANRLGLKPHGLPPGFLRPQNRLPKRAPAIVKAQQTLRLDREKRPPRKAVQGPVTGGCRFIASDDFIERMNAGENIYCGAKIERPGESWCETHRAVVYNPVKPSSLEFLLPRKKNAA